MIFFFWGQTTRFCCYSALTLTTTWRCFHLYTFEECWWSLLYFLFSLKSMDLNLICCSCFLLNSAATHSLYPQSASGWCTLFVRFWATEMISLEFLVFEVGGFFFPLFPWAWSTVLFNSSELFCFIGSHLAKPHKHSLMQFLPAFYSSHLMFSHRNAPHLCLALEIGTNSNKWKPLLCKSWETAFLTWKR